MLKINSLFKNIYENKYLFKYLLLFFNFNDKILFGKALNKNYIKNYNFNGKDYNKKELDDIFHICDDCYCSLTSEQLFPIEDYLNKYYYKGNLKYNSDEEDSDYETDNSYISNYNNEYMINCLRIEKANEFICTTYCYIAIRAFLELLEEKNIKIIYDIDNINKNKISNNSYSEKIDSIANDIIYIPNKLSSCCLFEIIKVNFNSEIANDYYFYELVYKRIDQIYINGLVNKKYDLICTRCGIFGHSGESKTCIFYNKSYENKRIKIITKDIMNDLIETVIERDKKEKLNLKKCKNCKNNFFSNKCLMYMCKKCCNCENHKIKNIKKIKNKRK